jgi:1-acyl-sn-glycerol-3-phosphate acyltransferase
MTDADAGEGATVDGDGAVIRRAFSNPALALCRSVALFVMTATELLICMVRCIGRDEDGMLALARTVGVTWPRHCLYWMGIRVRVEGEVPDAPALLCPNHAGYVDILALGSACHTFFVARDDVESWPVVGRTFKMGRHLSIKRQRKSAVVEAIGEIAARLRKGYRVCVFLEGTSSGDGGVLPFHASLVQSAIDAEVVVVPVGIRWRSRDDAVDPGEDVAYWKDHVFEPHLFRLLGLTGIEVTIRFGEPIDVEGRDRKVIAEELRERVIELFGLSK